MSFFDKFFDENDDIKVKEIGSMGSIEFSIWTDPETNIEYIIVYSGYGLSITPRIDTDGSIKVNKLNTNK